MEIGIILDCAVDLVYTTKRGGRRRKEQENGVTYFVDEERRYYFQPAARRDRARSSSHWPACNDNNSGHTIRRTIDNGQDNC